MFQTMFQIKIGQIFKILRQNEGHAYSAVWIPVSTQIIWLYIPFSFHINNVLVYEIRI